MRARLDCGKVQLAELSDWYVQWRDAHPHEAVSALIEIISDLQRRILELERWRDRTSA